VAIRVDITIFVLAYELLFVTNLGALAVLRRVAFGTV